MAQDAGTLSRAFEGSTVTLKIDMPASNQGVDVKPRSDAPVDFGAVAKSIKAYGIGVHHGESIMVTKVVVKDHHIEFQLGGGGFGTFADILSTTPNSSVSYEGKSRRERDLENELEYTYDPAARRRLKDELDQEQRARSRDNAVASVINTQAQSAAAADERARRAVSGSRFNIQYSDGIPQNALTPAGIREALGKYVDFSADGAPKEAAPAAAPTPATPLALRKGLTVTQVEQLLGPAAAVSQKTEGSLDVTIREYSTEDKQRVTGKFVGGVLVDYAITPG